MQVNYFDLSEISSEERQRLYRRTGIELQDLISKVAPIVDEVRMRGDEAVCRFTKQFDGADMTPEMFRVTSEELERSVAELPGSLREAIDVSINNIRKFHEKQVDNPWEIEISPGIVAGEKIVHRVRRALRASWQRLLSFHDDDGGGTGQSCRCGAHRCGDASGSKRKTRLGHNSRGSTHRAG